MAARPSGWSSSWKRAAFGNGHGRGFGHADSDRRRDPEDRRSEGHRAALVLGRNPIGVPALKPGVVGGNFTTRASPSFSNGGFSMNGSRPDENTISVDGAIAIRTRSAGTIIGVQKSMRSRKCRC